MCAVPLPKKYNVTNIREKKPRFMSLVEMQQSRFKQWSALSCLIADCIFWLLPDTGRMHLAADTLRIRYSKGIKDCKWRRDLRRWKYFVFPRDWLTTTTDALYRNTVLTVRIWGFWFYLLVGAPPFQIFSRYSKLLGKHAIAIKECAVAR